MQKEHSTTVMNDRPNTDIEHVPIASSQSGTLLFCIHSGHRAAAIAATMRNMVQGSIKLMHTMRKRGDSIGFSSYTQYELILLLTPWMLSRPAKATYGWR